MTTREEKFETERKKMLSQMGVESEVIEVEEEVVVENGSEEKMIIIENPFDYDDEVSHKPIQRNKIPGFFMMMAITNGTNVMPFFNFIVFFMLIYFCLTMSIPCAAIIACMLWAVIRAQMFAIALCIRPFYGIK